jgi:hypothetical protein
MIVNDKAAGVASADEHKRCHREAGRPWRSRESPQIAMRAY